MSRVTQGMLNSQLMRNLNANLTRMETTQNQLATGRKINRPSDDPVGISYTMRYRSELSANTQYKENVDSALSWLDHVDSSLDSIGNIFQRARELAVKGANGSNPQTALDAIASEVEQLYEQMVTMGNTQFNGKYVFNGQKTDVPPYDAATAHLAEPDEGTIEFEIGVGVRMSVNVPGNKIFGDAGTPDNAFQALSDLKNALSTGDFDGVNSALAKIDSRTNTFLEVRADIGAKVNRIELASDRLDDININLQSLQSKVEDVDMAALITTLKTDEAVYQASLSVGSSIIRPTLIDYLR